MRLLVNNKITEDMITVNGESSTFPKINLINNTLIKKTYFDDYIDIDLGEAKTIDSIALVSTSDDAFIIQANSTESWASPPYELLIEQEINFINESYRYWRINFASETEYEPIAYSTGTDIKLTSPIASYDTQANFIPCAGMDSGDYYFAVNIGDRVWGNTLFATDPSGTSVIIPSDTVGSTYGSMFFDCVGQSVDWGYFASTSFNGLKTTYFPKSANGDGLGGYAKWYFHSSAFSYAFNGNQSEIHIAQNHSVYKGSTISDANLVVRWDGQIGPQGSATPDVLVDIDNPSGEYGITTGTSKVNYFYLGEYLQMPGSTPGIEPKKIPTDIKSISNMGVINKTPGSIIRSEIATFPSATQNEYDNFLNWYESTDRANNVFYVPFEESMDLKPPYFADIITDIGERDYFSYSWEITIQEAK